MTYSSGQPVDNRASTRRDVQVPIYINLANASSVVLGNTQDISLGGIKVKTEITPTPFQIGDKVIFSVSEDYLKCQGQGEILWTSPTSGIVRIRFTQLDEETRRSLDEFFHLAELQELLSQFRQLIERNLRTLVENGKRQDLLWELQRHHDQLQEMVARRTSELVKSKGMLEERVEFEDLVSNLSASFVNIPPDRVDGEIALALDQICRFFKADYCALVEVLADRKQAHYVNLNLQEERQRELLNVDITSGYPWAYHQLVEQGEPVIFSSLEALPPEARVDRAAFEKKGVRAGLMLPLRVGGQVTHLIGLGSLRNGHEWPVAHIRRLRVLGEVFANALIHKRTQEALLKSERGQAEASADQICLGMALEAADMVTWEWDIPTRSIRYSDNIRTIVRGVAVEPYCSLDALMPEIHPEDREGLAQALDQASKEGTPFECEYRVHMLDGTYRWILGKGKRVVMEGGKPVRMLGLSMDITERKRGEEALKNAFDEIKKLKEQLEAENIYLREEMQTAEGFTDIVGASNSIKYVKYRIQQVAGTRATVLLTGETGTGKGLFAHSLHEASNRKGKPFVHVNCAGLPPSLIESELFGREKGAFTGSTARQIGRFELANGGTILLDEIGELPLELQTKLLKVFEDGEFERLGSPHTVKVDVRIIASTNRNLEEEIKKGQFRNDLFYRINVFPITIPPLRQRKEDIPLLVKFYADRFTKTHRKDIKKIPMETMKALKDYAWPGNVRELMNVIERAVIVSEGPELRLAEKIDAIPSAHQEETDKVQEKTGTKALSKVEQEHILKTLQETGWRIEGPNGAARLLGMNPSTLRTRMKNLGIKRPGTH